MPLHRHSRSCRLVRLVLLPCLVSVLQGGVLWLELGSAVQPARNATGAVLTLGELQGLGVTAHDTTGAALGSADLAGLDAAGPGFFVGVIRIPECTVPTVRLRLGPAPDGLAVYLGEGALQPDDFIPYVDPQEFRIVCGDLVWQVLGRPYTVTFLTDGHGGFSGDPSQTVGLGNSTTPITAIPACGYTFQQWSDGSTANPRVLVGVSADVTLTASFRPAEPVAPDGQFLARVDPAAVTTGRGWWDLSGTYATVTGEMLVLNMVHDTKGKLSGTARYTTAQETVVTMPIRGAVTSRAGSVSATLTLKGTNAAKAATVALTLNLTLDSAERQLSGTMTGWVTLGAETTPVSATVTLAIPAPMDGGWALQFQLQENAGRVTGTATLTLANGVNCVCFVQGKRRGTSALLSLTGNPRDPAANGIEIRTTIDTLTGGWATLQALAGKGFGQTLAW